MGNKMNYEIIKNLNDQTKIAKYGEVLFVLKEIPLSDTDMYRKLINLNCDNIVKFYDTVTIDGCFFVVEEYVNGITLKDHIDTIGCLDDEQTKYIALQICNGLKEIHKLGIIHRDINPNNIMITSNGSVKIIDFGISRTVKRNQSFDTEILGTQGFTAPEQFGFHQTTAKSDIYSVGVLINYMKTKQLPGVKLTNGWLSEIVLKCTQIDEINRYDDIDDLIKSIEKKNKANHFFKSIPGFRKGVWWHYIIAITYYITLFVFLLFSLFIGISVKDSILTFGFFFFAFALPVPILTNYYNWTSRFEFIKNKTRFKKILIQIAFACLSVVVSFICIIADTNP